MDPTGLTDEQKAKYESDGYLVVESFLTATEVEEMKSAYLDLVHRHDPRDTKALFSTAHASEQNRDNYYAESVDKIHYFYEPEAFDSSGNLVVPKAESVSRIAHGLHWRDPTFRRHTFSQKVKSYVRSLGMVKPVVTQGMYICKSPRIGGEAKQHQDATYLYMEPMKLVGLWFALDDVTMDNGCLWFVPGSHKDDDLSARFIRNPDSQATSMFLHKKLSKVHYEDSDFVPATAKKGSCVFIHGMVMHKSAKNTSSKSRHAYTFHIIDTDGTRWAPDNWLQPTSTYQFPSLYNNNV